MQSVVGVAMVPEAILEKLEPMHYTLELIHCAAENEVIIICLPPHTTAGSQPLDRCCFCPPKTYWSEACHHIMFANPGRVVSKL